MLEDRQSEGGMSIGAQLRASREARGLTIDALAHTTRVQARILAAIERDDVRAVPPRPFGRGLVRAYAREIGLDADQTARDYFAQFAPVEPPATHEPHAHGVLRVERSHRWPLVIISVGVVGGITLALLTGRPARTTARPAPATVVGTSGTAGTSAAPASGDASSARTKPAEVATPPAPIPAAPLIIILTASSPSWVTADADGRRALYTTVMPGAPETLTAAREIVIRVGDAGALEWRVNGRDVGVMGRSGQVRDLRITPATAATIH
jgi:cytoskeleton protein RodZ